MSSSTHLAPPIPFWLDLGCDPFLSRFFRLAGAIVLDRSSREEVVEKFSPNMEIGDLSRYLLMEITHTPCIEIDIEFKLAEHCLEPWWTGWGVGFVLALVKLEIHITRLTMFLWNEKREANKFKSAKSGTEAMLFDCSWSNDIKSANGCAALFEEDSFSVFVLCCLTQLQLHAYSDSTWVSNPVYGRFVTGYCIFLVPSVQEADCGITIKYRGRPSIPCHNYFRYCLGPLVIVWYWCGMQGSYTSSLLYWLQMILSSMCWLYILEYVPAELQVADFFTKSQTREQHHRHSLKLCVRLSK